VEVAVALAAGLLIGLSLGTLGAGGSILAVPVLVLGLGQTPLQATTGSLVVVGATALLGAVATSRRSGSVRWGRGTAFGLVAVGGAAAGAGLATRLPDAVLLTAFAALLLVVATVMVVRRTRPAAVGDSTPILTLRPRLTCACPRALRVVVTATGIGLLTGLLGVGGGFLVVPALVLALGLSMRDAAGTSLVVIAVTTTAAFLVRLGGPSHPDWGLVVLLTAAAVTGALAGTRVAPRIPAAALQTTFATVLILVAGVTAWHAVPALA
jgi:uncharacterized membrane protein YfcA